MKGWYVIPVKSDLEEFTGRGAKSRAIKRAKQLYNEGDSDVAIIHFDDNNDDGFLAGEDLILYRSIKEGRC